ncbi:MAG TPA: outer membrane beta-barrel protein [Bacteroidales bacterium]|nr:outer membrane beta-barrel protein [Bacteroidales bacterium]HOH22524.1 outer membrane beta-barrel protein [Bacteroidales bacterium]HPZ02972.1 outer membrane beta-barrel protein [Bacteroidales bacterium]HQB75376.1 outer membrane beta-barrel protein [Bacteroidales bacterium]HQQ20507.1 outer membrane beta-barrel protein [Bacteroidales bacterium]
MKSNSLRKIAFLSLLFIGVTYSLSASSLLLNKNNWGGDRGWFGPKTSLHFNKIYFNENFRSSFEPGFELGFFFRIGKRFYFQPEILYSFRSLDFDLMLDEIQTNIQAKNHYLILPVGVGIKILKARDFNLRIFGGAKLGYRISTNSEYVDQLMNPFEVGYEVGVGVDLWRFTLDFGYNAFYSKPENKEITNSIISQSVYNLGIGFKF